MDEIVKIPSSLSKFFWQFVKRYKFHFLGMFGTATLLSISNALTPFLIKLIIDGVVSFKGDPRDVYAVVWIPATAYIALRIVLSIFMRIEDLIRIHTIPQVKSEIRQNMFKHLLRHSFEFFQSQMSGNISNKIINMASSFERIFISIHEGIFVCITSFAISTFLLYKTVPIFAIFFIIWFLFSLSITAYLSTRSIALSNGRAAAESAVAGNIVDVFRNILTVLTFFNRKYEDKYLQHVQNQEIRAAKTLEWELIKIHIVRSTSTTVMMVCMLFFLIEGWKCGWVTIGDFSFVSSTAFSIAHLTWYTSKELVVLYKEWGVAQQALDLLKIPYTNLDLPNATPLQVRDGAIRFENVTFKYPAGSEVFENQTVKIAPGQKVGLVGLSGSGKTTFIKLTMRFFNPQSGRVEIDQHDIRYATMASICESIAMIPQNPGLFNRTVAENIAYGKEGATMEEIIAAAKQAHCDEFINRLENGYDTLIGEQGEKLSAGQKQRLAIARAMIKSKARILILDEATSALDSITEQYIQQSITALMKNRTALVIAHRLSTILSMDRILVFDEGKIVEDGTHAELLARHGKYAKLWKIQSQDSITTSDQL